MPSAAPESRGDALTAASAAISSLFETLRPIHEFFESVLGAVAPLRWLFDAAEYLSDHILKPVIETIIEACGISKLVDGLAEKIGGPLKAALDLLDGFTSAVNFETIKELKARFGEAAAEAVSEHWAALGGALEAYQPQKDGSFREVLLRVFRSVWDQLTGPMPDWPVGPVPGR